jgi:CRISPR-associated protein Cas2
VERRRYLVAYDIRDDRRLRDVARCMEGYGDRVQYSVFVCDLVRRQLARMCADLESLIRPADDSVMIVDLGVTDAVDRFEFLGRPPAMPDTGAKIV